MLNISVSPVWCKIQLLTVGNGCVPADSCRLAFRLQEGCTGAAADGSTTHFFFFFFPVLSSTIFCHSLSLWTVSLIASVTLTELLREGIFSVIPDLKNQHTSTVAAPVFLRALPKKNGKKKYILTKGKTSQLSLKKHLMPC